MRCCALHQQLSRRDQGGDLIAHHALVEGVVGLAEVTDGQVASQGVGAVPGQVEAIALPTEDRVT